MSQITLTNSSTFTEALTHMAPVRESSALHGKWRLYALGTVLLITFGRALNRQVDSTLEQKIQLVCKL